MFFRKSIVILIKMSYLIFSHISNNFILSSKLMCQIEIFQFELLCFFSNKVKKVLRAFVESQSLRISFNNTMLQRKKKKTFLLTKETAVKYPGTILAQFTIHVPLYFLSFVQIYMYTHEVQRKFTNIASKINPLSKIILNTSQKCTNFRNNFWHDP